MPLPERCPSAVGVEAPFAFMYDRQSADIVHYFCLQGTQKVELHGPVPSWRFESGSDGQHRHQSSLRPIVWKMGNNVDFWLIMADSLAAQQPDGGATFPHWASALLQDGDGDGLGEVLDFLSEEPDGFRHIGDSFERTWGFFDDLNLRIVPRLDDPTLVAGLGEVEPRLPAQEHLVIQGLRFPGWAIFDSSEAKVLATATVAALAADPAWESDSAGNGPIWRQIATALNNETYDFCLITFQV